MVQRARRTQLQRTVSGLFYVEIRVGIAFPLFHLFTIIGDYFYSWVYMYQLFSIPRFRRSLIHSTPAKAEMAAVTRLSLSPVVARNVANERYPLPYSQQYIHVSIL